MSRTLFTTFIVTALFLSPLSVLAQTRVEQTSTSVFYGDLDLSKPAGMQTLQRRLKAASLQVCGDTRGTLGTGTTDQAHCAQDAVANALTAIGKAQNRVLANNERTR